MAVRLACSVRVPPPTLNRMVDAVSVPAARIALSSASVYPESPAAAFELAARLGFDGVELLVFTDPVSQDVDAVQRLSDHYAVPGARRPRALPPGHPTRLGQRAVGRSSSSPRRPPRRLGASTVVVHPPFRWQRDYAKGFVEGVARMAEETAVTFAVENMYPWRARSREIQAYAPAWDPTDEDYAHLTLDLSHTAVSGSDAMAMLGAFGDRLAHVHLADGTGVARDEHLVPGRGAQPCAAVLETLAVQGFAGTIVLEVSTRKAANRAEREADLAEALAFARLNLAAATASPLSPEVGDPGAARLHVVRGDRPVLRGVDVDVATGTVTGLLGPSGCGKSTFIRAVVGVQKVAGGTVDVLGLPAGSASLRHRVAYVTQASAVYADLTVRENLDYFATIARRGPV